MLVNKPKSGRVKFVSYTGEYPCLCNGVLTLEIDGKAYKFGHNYRDYCHYDEKAKKWVFTDGDPEHPNFDSFWISGGDVVCGENYNYDILSGEWKIDAEDLPEQFRNLASEIDEVFNDNVPFGCCGGCI